jgi:hypothetical protein
MFTIYTGKESNNYEEVEQGTIHDWDQVRSEYYDPREDPWRTIVVPVLKTMNRSDLASRCDVSERHIARLRNRNEMPSPELRERLTRIAGDYSRQRSSVALPISDLQACWLYLVNLTAASE